MASESDNEKLFQENLEIVDYLKNSRLFGHIPQGLLNQLEPLSEIVTFPPQTEILTEGQENDRVYLMMRGEVEIFAKGEPILTLKRQGDIFGEMSIISSKPCSATVLSKTPVTLFTVNARNVGKYSDIDYGDVRNFFYRVFAMILTEKLTLTTAKARQYESTNTLLEETKISLEQKIEEQKLAEENRLKLESQLRHSQKLEAIGTLAGGIAHDFNNLLFTMLGYISMAKDDLPEDSRAREDLEESLIAGNRAKELVQQILTFSRHQEGEKKPIQITPLIKETIKFIRSSLPRTINIRENITDDPGIILGDPSQIHQVVMNLCTNAGYAMKEDGGVLTLELSQTYVNREFADSHGLSVGDYLVMTVRDTGCGIDDEAIDRIFDPFFTTKPVGEGSGMGLAVVHGIVSNFDGAITVSSVVGEGSEFQVYLPMIPNVVGTDNQKEPRPNSGQERILIVDSEQAITNLLKRTLERSGYKVEALNEAQEAIDSVQHHPERFDLIIVDQFMPHYPGTTLSERFRESNPAIKLVLTVNHDSGVTREEASRIGVNEVLTRPVQLDRLSHIVRNVLDRDSNSM